MKWVGLILCIALAVAFTLSRWYSLAYRAGRYEGGLAAGRVLFRVFDRPPSTKEGLRVASIRAWRWWVKRSDAFFLNPDDTLVGFRSWAYPLWIVFVPVAAVTGVLWWRARHKDPLSCAFCGYCLIGNVSGRCPECGAAVPRKAVGNVHRSQ